VNPLSHYLAIVALRESVKQKRDAYVRMLAGIIDATRYTLDPANADKVAEIAATVTGRTPRLAREILPRMAKIGLWPVGKDGLDKANLEAVIAVEKELGGIKPGKAPVRYEKLVDRTVWKDASAMVKK
jgi:NitT/TauT family transport system substrate-binding protein